MKYTPGEDYAKWAERVKLHELNIAFKQVDKGVDLETVIEIMSSRITEKLMHPLIEELKNYQLEVLKK